MTQSVNTSSKMSSFAAFKTLKGKERASLIATSICIGLFTLGIGGMIYFAYQLRSLKNRVVVLSPQSEPITKSLDELNEALKEVIENTEWSEEKQQAAYEECREAAYNPEQGQAAVHCQEVLSHVYVGSINALKEADPCKYVDGEGHVHNVDDGYRRLKRNRPIFHSIISIATSVENNKAHSNDVSLPDELEEHHLEIFAHDDRKDREGSWGILEDNFEEGFKMIDEARTNGKNILVHCAQGQSRSGAFLAAYLINRCGVSAKEALHYLALKRGMIDPNPTLRSALSKYSLRYRALELKPLPLEAYKYTSSDPCEIQHPVLKATLVEKEFSDEEKEILEKLNDNLSQDIENHEWSNDKYTEAIEKSNQEMHLNVPGEIVHSNEIIPHVYLGSANALIETNSYIFVDYNGDFRESEEEFTKRPKFTRVISILPDSVTSEKRPTWKYPLKIDEELYEKQLEIQADDKSDQDWKAMKEHFEIGFQMIDEARLENENILIHCELGQSRSGTFLLAYLINRCHVSAENALKYIQLRRGYVKPNKSFIQALENYAQEINKKD